MKLLVYSHDAFGLGNLRRMLAICEHLSETIPQISILFISGSPIIHSFRLPQGLDYIKLPCLGRDRNGNLAAKFLGTSVEETVKLRSQLIHMATLNFQPDLFLVDKKPYGLKNELKPTLNYLKAFSPQTQNILLLRDILDTPEKTIEDWTQYGYYDALELFYDRILAVGTPEVFDLVREYQFSPESAKKVKFCGYIRKKNGRKSQQDVRRELKVLPEEKLVLVTPGGGEDGARLIENYLNGLASLSCDRIPRTLIICGPEMPIQQRQNFFTIARHYTQVMMREFSDDLMSYMAAADAVVSMGGYNTISEILSLNKPAVVVPRVHPVREQLIRSQRLAELGLLKSIHPDILTPQNLITAVLDCLNSQDLIRDSARIKIPVQLDLGALPCIQSEISQLLWSQKLSKPPQSPTVLAS
ncbi:glycosyltransferase [Oscillatoriales cyanobacterium LEGE 11467]|uniref:Glycosyltransferase n=1 Tax=Zarconia navalis LEGE 11467 TaxID=1828826 RepID=A0A928VW05_9CYAN|nr:glycosyltransferase [Zarconia navalis]MBE9041359.1 glycosyltransferase [Zarconia navalis LEGE 11467]